MLLQKHFVILHLLVEFAIFMAESAFYNKGELHVLYPMQLVTPSVVAIAVSMLMAICRIVFQVFAFIFFEC